MADPSLFPFVDQLMAKCFALPVVSTLSVAVWDGMPSTFEADNILAIGATVTPISDAKQQFAQLGYMAMWEEYYVSGLINCVVAGDSGASSTDAANAQRASRNNATTILNALFEALRSDPNFAQANGGTPLILFCRLEDVSVIQQASERGRETQIEFRIYVKNRINQT